MIETIQQFLTDLPVDRTTLIVIGLFTRLAALGMIDSDDAPDADEPLESRGSGWVRARRSGIASMSVALGQMVTRGQHIAVIHDSLGKRLSQVAAPFDGIVIGCSRLPLAHEGDALFHLAAFRSVGRAESAVEEFATIHDPALRRTVESDLLET